MMQQRGMPVQGRYPPGAPQHGTPQQQAAMRQRQMPNQMMHAGTPMNMQQQQAAQAAARQQQMARKKKRYADKLVPPSVRDLVPESQAYMDLLAFEQKLDSTIMRKKLDIQEALKRPLKMKKRLRIYISHTFTPGKEPEKEGDEAAVPMWELRVEGRLLDETSAAAGAAPPTTMQAANRTNPPVKRKFSSFFKSLVIELDKDIYGPDNHLVEWHRTPQTNETDGFQVKRPGDKPVTAKIMLLLDYQPMRFKLHPRLAKLLGFACDTRPKIVEALWQYIKTHSLQDATDRDVINCDRYLQEIFMTPKMRFMEIPQRLHPLLQQPDHLTLHHTIEQSEGNDKNTACYDIEVEVDDPIKANMTSFMTTQAHVQDIAQLDQKIYDIVDQINEWKTRRDFYVRFSDSPHEFIQEWLISQAQDLKGMSEYGGEGEIERKAEYYFQPTVQEGVFRYIYQRVQQKRAELEQSLGVRNN